MSSKGSDSKSFCTLSAYFSWIGKTGTRSKLRFRLKLLILRIPLMFLDDKIMVGVIALASRFRIRRHAHACSWLRGGGNLYTYFASFFNFWNLLRPFKRNIWELILEHFLSSSFKDTPIHVHYFQVEEICILIFFLYFNYCTFLGLSKEVFWHGFWILILLSLNIDDLLAKVLK